MRVLLVPQKSNYPERRPCMHIIGQGLPYIAAALKAGGHEVFVANLNYHWCQGSAVRALEELLRRKISDHQPDLIGVSGLSADYPFVRDAIRLCGKIAPDTPIVCGGGIMTYDARFIFDDLRPDFGIVGEGEESVVALADAIASGSGFGHVPNLLYRQAGRTVENTASYSQDNLDDLAFPDYDLFDIETYLEWANQGDNWFYAHTRHRPRVVPISLARSCPYKCTFCCHMDGPKYRVRSTDNAIEEIIALYERYRFNLLFVYDELFSLRKDRVLEFCQRVSELGYDFHWTCGFRVGDASPELLAEMRKAGCIFIGYGLESANQAVLESMKKRTTVEQIKQAIMITNEAGLGVQGNFIFGDPAETPQTIAETVTFYDRWCRDLMVRFNYVTPYPGSEIFQQCLESGIISSREAYYRNISGIGTRMTNMTAMPEKQMKLLLDEAFHDELVNHATADADSCLRREIPACDAGAPPESRRTLYELSLKCPHCGQAITYLYPLRRDSRCVEAMCAACHKRMLIRTHISGEDLPDESLPPAAVYDYDTPCVVDVHKGFNLVAFRGRVYSLCQAMGPIDLNATDENDILAYEAAGQCFRTQTVADARQKIDSARTVLMCLRDGLLIFKSRLRRFAGRARRRIMRRGGGTTRRLLRPRRPGQDIHRE